MAGPAGSGCAQAWRPPSGTVWVAAHAGAAGWAGGGAGSGVDTVGAGDSFAGAFAVGYAEGMALHEAVKFAKALYDDWTLMDWDDWYSGRKDGLVWDPEKKRFVQKE